MAKYYYPPREIIDPKVTAESMMENKVRRILATHDEMEERQKRSMQMRSTSQRSNSQAPIIPILKSTLLKDEVNMNALGKGAFSQLSLGMDSFEVLKVQEALHKVNVYHGKANGNFGSETEEAVKTFQNSYIPTHTTHATYQFNTTDGVVGKNTVLALDEAITEGWVNITPLFLPQIIYKTQRKMGDFEADDMKYGDLSEAALIKDYKLNEVPLSDGIIAYPYTNQIIPAQKAGYSFAPLNNLKKVSKEEMVTLLFDELREGSQNFRWGKYSGLMDTMIDRFQTNEGGVLSLPLLSEAMEEEILSGYEPGNDENILEQIRITLRENIDWEYKIYPESKKNQFEININKDVDRPQFSGFWDYVNGLGITVHDIWSLHVSLESLEISGTQFKAKVTIKIQDHFGLDGLDILKTKFRMVPMFKAWFILQRWDKYGYQPFINEMNVQLDIEGEK